MNPFFQNRYISPKYLSQYLDENFHSQIRTLGISHRGHQIKKICIGRGKKTIGAWTQMHGNESTATLAILDLLYEEFYKSKIFDEIKLEIILMLNPDGAEDWTRFTPSGIDINRDFHTEKSIEIRILKDFIFNSDFYFCINLHDQRTIFSTDGIHPATLSFLSPSFNLQREINKTRLLTMNLCSRIYADLKENLGPRIGRYNDTYYPNSIGDNLHKAGIPCLLIEGGYYDDGNLDRLKTREFYKLALIYAFKNISKGLEYDAEEYFTIPENKESHYDIVYRNIFFNNQIQDIAIQYEEILQNDQLIYLPKIVEIDKYIKRKGWIEKNKMDKDLSNLL